MKSDSVIRIKFDEGSGNVAFDSNGIAYFESPSTPVDYFDSAVAETDRSSALVKSEMFLDVTD